MKAVISCTADEKYSYFIPIVTWAWNKLDVGVILFLPESSKVDKKIQLGLNCMNYGYKENNHYYFDAPKHKEATYAQCSRLYGACLDLPEGEILITGDADMAVFKLPPMEQVHQLFSVFGADLVPENQLPICYQYATVKEWRNVFKLDGRNYQKCLDDLLGNIEAEHFRGNYWGKDQEESYNRVTEGNNRAALYNRARPNTQFASHRVDRTDLHYMDRLDHEIIDAHLWRPGFTDENFEKILHLLQFMYPDENFDWLISYTNAYKQLL